MIGSQNISYGTQEVTPEIQYKISTKCELIYSMTYKMFPDGSVLPDATVYGIMEKYPKEFEPWDDVFGDPVKHQAFVELGYSDVFIDVFTETVMMEYSINPELKDAMSQILDPNVEFVGQQFFDENDCQAYFNQQNEKLEN